MIKSAGGPSRGLCAISAACSGMSSDGHAPPTISGVPIAGGSYPLRLGRPQTDADGQDRPGAAAWRGRLRRRRGGVDRELVRGRVASAGREHRDAVLGQLLASAGAVATMAARRPCRGPSSRAA